MKILFVSYSFYPAVGGIESSALLLLREFRKFGHELVVVTDSVLGGEDEVDWPVTHRRPGWTLQRRLAKWADVVYHHNPGFTYWGTMIARRPLVFSIRTWVSRTDRSVTWKDRLKLGVLSRFPCISNSRATAEHLLGDSEVIENAYDDIVFEALNPWEQRDGAAFVGRLVSDKGVPTALEAIAHCKSMGINLPLRIIGSGPDEASLREQAKELGIADHVIFSGRLAPYEVAATLNQVKYLLVPSKWQEPFGIVALEGIACGCIPLGTNQGGLVDAIGKCGPLFQKDDSKQLADWLCRLESEPALIERYREPHQAHLTEHSPKTITSRYLEVFEDAIRSRQ